MAGEASERPGLGSEISFFLCASGTAAFEFLCAAPFAPADSPQSTTAGDNEFHNKSRTGRRRRRKGEDGDFG